MGSMAAGIAGDDWCDWSSPLAAIICPGGQRAGGSSSLVHLPGRGMVQGEILAAQRVHQAAEVDLVGFYPVFTFPDPATGVGMLPHDGWGRGGAADCRPTLDGVPYDLVDGDHRRWAGRIRLARLPAAGIGWKMAVLAGGCFHDRGARMLAPTPILYWLYLAVTIFVLVFLAFGIGFTPLINRVYQHTGGSILAVILFHGLVNAGLDIFPPVGPWVNGSSLPLLFVGVFYGLLAGWVDFKNHKTTALEGKKVPESITVKK